MVGSVVGLVVLVVLVVLVGWVEVKRKIKVESICGSTNKFAGLVRNFYKEFVLNLR